MKRRTLIAAAIGVIALPTMVDAQGFGGRPGGMSASGGRPAAPSFMKELYPPQLIMRNQFEIGIDDAQRQAILTSTRDARNAIEPIQWDLQREQQQLTRLLSSDRVDESALLAQAEKVMELEKRMKTQNLLLLVKIKNQLTPEQQKQARMLRESMPRGGVGRDHPGGARPGRRALGEP